MVLASVPGKTGLTALQQQQARAVVEGGEKSLLGVANGARGWTQTADEASYKQALGNYDMAARTTFSISLPGLLTVRPRGGTSWFSSSSRSRDRRGGAGRSPAAQEMHELEVKRVEAIKRSAARGLALLRPATVDTAACDAALAAVRPEVIATCHMSLEVGVCFFFFSFLE